MSRHIGHPQADAQALTTAVAPSVPTGIRWRIEVRPQRRRLALSIDEFGTLTVLAPPRTAPRDVTALLTAKRSWILRHAAKATEAPDAPVTKQLIDGETFPYLGENLSLTLVDDPRGRARALYEPGDVPRLLLPRHCARDSRAVIAWYCEAGLAWANKHATLWAPRLRLTQLPALEVRSLGRTRWGIYQTAHHRVRLHWELFQLPPDAPEVTLVHELVHATHPPGKPHGPAWQRRMAAALPDWRLRKEAQDAQRAWIWRGDLQSPVTPPERTLHP